MQMAHARLSGMFRVGGIDPATVTADGVDFDRLALPEETELMKALLDFPALAEGAAAVLEPHRVATYLHDTAARIPLWDHTAHVLNTPAESTRSRLLLASYAQIGVLNWRL